MGIASPRMIEKKLKNLSPFVPFGKIPGPGYADLCGPDDEAEERRKAGIAS